MRLHMDALFVVIIIAMHGKSIEIAVATLHNGEQLDIDSKILTSLSLSLELSASLGATDDVVSRSDALPLSSDVLGSFAIVSEFCNGK